MTEAPKIGSSVLVGVMALIGAVGWLLSEVVSDPPLGPIYVDRRAAPAERAIIPANDSLLPNEAVVSHSEPGPLVERPVARTPEPLTSRPARTVEQRRPLAKAKAKAPVAKAGVSRPVVALKSPTPPTAISTSRAAIIVEERRLTRDERIEVEVMERLVSNPRLSGKIGVESKDAVVRLTGWTHTVGQARRAEREARSVSSVKYVQNEIRPRIGGSV